LQPFDFSLHGSVITDDECGQISFSWREHVVGSLVRVTDWLKWQESSGSVSDAKEPYLESRTPHQIDPQMQLEVSASVITI